MGKIDYLSINKNNKLYRSNNYIKGEPYLCQSCKRVWQRSRDYSSKSEFLGGFPKIGCTTKICTTCQEGETR